MQNYCSLISLSLVQPLIQAIAFKMSLNQRQNVVTFLRTVFKPINSPSCGVKFVLLRGLVIKPNPTKTKVHLAKTFLNTHSKSAITWSKVSKLALQMTSVYESRAQPFKLQ